MKKTFKSILALFIVILTVTSSASAVFDPELTKRNLEKLYYVIFDKGSGTEEDPYILDEVEDFKFMSETIFTSKYPYKGKYFLLDRDLYFNDIEKPIEEWAGYFPIGWDEVAFEGHFDGGGHTIYGFRSLNVKYNSTMGLFGVINNGSIKNLTLSNSYVFKGYVLADSIYYNNGKTALAVENCHIVNALDKTSLFNQVIAMEGSNITLRNCTVEGSTDDMITKIKSEDASSVTIDGFKRMPKIKQGEDGETLIRSIKSGIIGELYIFNGEDEGEIIIENCVNDCYVEDTFNNSYYMDRGDYRYGAVGGILNTSLRRGDNDIIRNCINNGPIYGTGGVGGVTGCFSGKIENCINNGWVYGTEARIGGIVGDHISGDIENCVNNGNVGVANTQIVTITSKIGGIAGYSNGVIESTANYGEIYGEYGSMEVGGIAGRAAYIYNSANFGKVINAPAGVGGIAGTVGAKVKDAYVDNCFNAGLIEGSESSSGSVIGVSKCPTKNCYYLAGTYKQGRYTDKEDADFNHPDFKELKFEEMMKKDSYIGFDFENKWIMPSEEGFPVPRGSYFGDVAKPAVTKISVNGNECSVFCYNIKGNNYLKIRDIALLLENTKSEFSVSWDDDKKMISLKKNEKYKSVGSENQALKDYDRAVNQKNEKLLKDGKEISLKAYMIDGSNYFVLRDVAEILEFEISWNEKDRRVEISA